jgi:hypothetical protein
VFGARSGFVYPKFWTGDSCAAAQFAPDSAVAESPKSQPGEQQIWPTALRATRPIARPQASVYRIMEPTMARRLKLVPDPYIVTLRRICLAQAIISVSALTSTAVLLSQVVRVMNGSQ